MRKFVKRKTDRPKGKGAPTTEGPREIRLPRGKEVFGVVEALHGGKRMTVRCSDGKIRMCRIPGAKKRMWVRSDSYVIVEPWEVEGDKKADIVYKYHPTDVEQLKRRGLLDTL